RFVREQELAQSREPADAGSAQLLTEVKLSLLRLYDQRGESAKAVDIVQNLRASEDTPDAVMAHLDEWYSYLDLIGQPFEAKLQTTDGKMWHRAEHRGKVVLLCFLASWFKPSRLETEAVITRSE